MTAGVTAKLAPLALLPIGVPVVGSVYQRIVLPAEVAFRFEVPPLNITDGVAVTGSGEEGDKKTVTVTEIVQTHAFEFV